MSRPASGAAHRDEIEREFSFRVDAPIDAVATLLSDPQRLDSLTPSWFGLRPIAGPSGELSVGSEVDYRLRWRGLPRRWRSRIVEWRLPRVFTYEQARGPFRSFRHRHLLAPDTTGTRVVDRVTYAVAGGGLVDGLLVAPDLRRIFDYRAEAVRRELARTALPDERRRSGRRQLVSSAVPPEKCIP